MVEYRTYQLKWAPWALRATYPIAIAFSVLIIWEYASQHKIALWVALILLAAFVMIMVWGETMGVRAGVYESEHGLTCRWLYGSYSLAWAEVLQVEHKKLGTKDLVYAQMTNDHYRRLVGILQGQRVIWEGGETRDIVGVLNQRLRERNHTASV